MDWVQANAIAGRSVCKLHLFTAADGSPLLAFAGLWGR
jgi:hypothetical protein